MQYIETWNQGLVTGSSTTWLPSKEGDGKSHSAPNSDKVITFKSIRAQTSKAVAGAPGQKEGGPSLRAAAQRSCLLKPGVAQQGLGWRWAPLQSWISRPDSLLTMKGA